MGLPGQAPKDPDDRLRRNKDMFETTVIDWDGKTRGPLLPKDRGWHPQTVKWWRHWRNSPNAMVMTENDWDELLMAAILYDCVWMGETIGVDGRIRQMSVQSKVQALAQVRRVTAEFGATFGDRMKLRLKIRTDYTDKSFEDRVQADAVEMVDYAERLTKKVAEIQED